MTDTKSTLLTRRAVVQSLCSVVATPWFFTTPDGLNLTLARSSSAVSGETKNPAKTFPLDTTKGLEVVGGQAEVATYRGRNSVRFIPTPERHGSNDSVLAILAPEFNDGTIEAEIAGFPRPGVSPDERGFVGIAFRVQPQGSRYECFYLRPTNGRADDQFRRNHSTQYVSEPDYPWYRLRQESPGVYESYADMEGGAWTKIKIAVAGVKAQLYINGADQPALIVNDLKLGESRGQVALWAHWTTDAHFSSLTIR